MIADHALAAEYLRTLESYVAGAGEAALTDAYELGRRAIGQGLGVMDIAAIHHQALSAVLRTMSTPEEWVRVTAFAAVVEGESLSVFEMALRGYREANSELTRSNEQLRRLAAELQEVAGAEREARVESQRTHQALQETQGQLVQSAKLAALGELVAGVAHEINNPLAFITSYYAVLGRDLRALQDLVKMYEAQAEVLAEHRPEAYRTIRDYADRIDLPYLLGNLEQILARSRDGFRRIQQIVQDLRDFARVDDDVRSVVPDLLPGIESTLNILRGRAVNRRVAIRTDLGPLPPLPCSQGKINQVVLNLVANAIDACAPGGAVEVRTRATADEAEIHVIDDGSGIDPAVRDRIFDPFFTTKPQGQGTGLGLSISHGIAEEHGGRITVESEPGHGAHFTLHLPLDGRSLR